jgi:PAS domain S-box-containing protein
MALPPDPDVLHQTALLLHLPFPVYLTDAAGYLLFYNEEAAALLGRSPEIGKELYSTTAGEERVIDRPDGTQRTIISHPKPLFDSSGNLIGSITTLIDITVRRKSEAEIGRQHAELKRSEERYHKMISEVEDYAILLLNEQGIIQNWNVGAEKIKGYTEKEIVGRHFRVFYTKEDQEIALPEKLIEEARREGKAIHEGWRQRKDGTLFWGSIVITALHDESGGVMGFSKVTRDLTARRVAEEKLRRYSVDLEFQNQQLQQFAYAAAHDMKEPLRKLRFYNTSAIESLQGRLSEKENQYLQRSADAARRMQALIDDLLSYSKASIQGDGMGPVDLNDILSEAKSGYEDTLDETKASLETDDLPVVWGVAFQLRQLFENLLGNALKYRHPDRAPVIRISCKKGINFSDGQIALNGMGEKYYEIAIRDNGIGFEKEKADKIFEIFQRLHNREVYPGSGIGLAICKRVIQNHKGFIRANGVPDQGAVFTLYLPMGAKR